jgi:hypothetical protein
MNRSYHRRLESEDEFVFFVLPTLQAESSQSSERRPMYTSEMIGAHRVTEILTGHESLCKRNFRMEVGIFQALVNKLRERNLLADTRSVAVEEQVAIFLYVMAKKCK